MPPERDDRQLNGTQADDVRVHTTHEQIAHSRCSAAKFERINHHSPQQSVGLRIHFRITMSAADATAAAGGAATAVAASTRPPKPEFSVVGEHAAEI